MAVQTKKTEKGLVIVYTGDGKGKTTAALGLALRTSGYGKKVLIVQFGKSSFSGEINALKKFGSQIKLVQGGKGFVGILGDQKPLEEHKKAAEDAFAYLQKELKTSNWDLVIADEILGVVKGHLLDELQVLHLIDKKKQDADLVLTGRGASQKIISKADLVTEMKSIKHPFEKGIQAKLGIDY